MRSCSLCYSDVQTFSTDALTGSSLAGPFTRSRARLAKATAAETKAKASKAKAKTSEHVIDLTLDDSDSDAAPIPEPTSSPLLAVARRVDAHRLNAGHTPGPNVPVSRTEVPDTTSAVSVGHSSSPDTKCGTPKSAVAGRSPTPSIKLGTPESNSSLRSASAGHRSTSHKENTKPPRAGENRDLSRLIEFHFFMVRICSSLSFLSDFFLGGTSPSEKNLVTKWSYRCIHHE